jgi:hypothetical protein
MVRMKKRNSVAVAALTLPEHPENALAQPAVPGIAADAFVPDLRDLDPWQRQWRLDDDEREPLDEVCGQPFG